MCEALLAVRQRTRGPLGIGSRRDRRAARFSGKARQPPAPAACACVGAQAKNRWAAQDDDRSDRRGATGSAGVEAELTLRSVSVCACDFAAVAQAAWVLGLLTALLTITRKSDYLRAVWDGDGL